MLYICTKFCKIISIWKITKGNNSAKNVGGVAIFNLCMLSGHALYFYKV